MIIRINLENYFVNILYIFYVDLMYAIFKLLLFI